MTHSQIRPHYATQTKYLSSTIFYNVKIFLWHNGQFRISIYTIEFPLNYYTDYLMKIRFFTTRLGQKRKIKFLNSKHSSEILFDLRIQMSTTE